MTWEPISALTKDILPGSCQMAFLRLLAATREKMFQ